MKLFHENPIFETVKSKVIISLFETVRLSVSISRRNLYVIEKYKRNSYPFIILASHFGGRPFKFILILVLKIIHGGGKVLFPHSFYVDRVTPEVCYDFFKLGRFLKQKSKSLGAMGTFSK